MQLPKQRPKNSRSQDAITSRKYIHLWILIVKVERCFLNTLKDLAKSDPVANYATFANQAKSAVVRLNVFQGYSQIIKALDFITVTSE